MILAMPKNLGQIHTVNYTLTGGTSIGAGLNRWIIDLPGQLTSQLNHMVRMGTIVKVVGIDATLTDPATGTGGASVTGTLRYYAPTRGRCLAYKDAYKAVRRAMKIKGIDPTNNINYDFRCILQPPASYINGGAMANIASIQYDYTNQNWVPLCIDNNPGFQTVFDTWNTGLEPRQGQVGAPDFSTGYDVQLGGESFRTTGVSTGAAVPVNPDYVLQEGMLLQSSKDFASDEYEEIPFTLGNSDGTSIALELEWRPDPALYLSVLTGQFDVLVTEFKDADVGAFYEMDFAFHVAGWKSIMGSGRRHSKKGKKHGKKRRSKK